MLLLSLFFNVNWAESLDGMFFSFLQSLPKIIFFFALFSPNSPHSRFTFVGCYTYLKNFTRINLIFVVKFQLIASQRSRYLHYGDGFEIGFVIKLILFFQISFPRSICDVSVAALNKKKIIEKDFHFHSSTHIYLHF